VTRLATAAAIAAVLLVAAFLAGRWTKRCECAPDLPALAQDSTGFVEAYVTPPSGPRLRPTQEVRSAEPTHLPLAGCEPGATTPDTSLPRVTLEPIVAIRAEPGSVSVVRQGDEGLVATTYELPERGNRLAVTLSEDRPTVVGDRWWWLRDVELVASAPLDSTAYRTTLIGVKVPIGERWSLQVGRGLDKRLWVGASWRPFVRWP